MRDKQWSVALLAGMGALALVPFASGGGAETAKSTATLQLNARLALVSVRAAACPPGTRAGILCPGRTAVGVVPGLGRVAESYSYLVEETPSSCPVGSAKVLGYPVRWVVAGKGEIYFTVRERPECLAGDAAISADQAFTVTGGTGIYAGASGSGNADRSLGPTEAGAAGSETWTGTLTVPGLAFDLTPPTLSGARSKSVRAPRGAARARVTFAVTARDDVDGSVAASCKPASGSRFKIGRTAVSCSARDTSGNVATARFTITVMRGR